MAALHPAGWIALPLSHASGRPSIRGSKPVGRSGDQFTFIEPFRLDPAAIRPGDATAQMSLPWQSDFLDCAVESGNIGQDLTWWPAQRPISVRQTPSGPAISWARAFGNDGDLTPEQMVVDWSRLGLVLPVGDALFERYRND